MKTALFDMDGLIIDSEILYLEACEIVFPKMDLVYNEEVIKKCIGKNKKGTEDELVLYYGEDFNMDDFSSLVNIELEKLYHSRDILKPFVVETLTFLKNDGYKIAVATSTKKVKAEKLLKLVGVFEFFDEIVGGDMVKNSKPDPEIFLKACEILGGTPPETLVFEDSFNGVTAGFDGGFKVIMIPDILMPTEEIKAKTNEIHSNLGEFLKNSKLI